MSATTLFPTLEGLRESQFAIDEVVSDNYIAINQVHDITQHRLAELTTAAHSRGISIADDFGLSLKCLKPFKKLSKAVARGVHFVRGIRAKIKEGEAISHRIARDIYCLNHPAKPVI